MKLDNWKDYIDLFRSSGTPFTLDWGSNELRSVKHRDMMAAKGIHMTQHALVAIVLGETKFVFATCGGAFLFYYNGDNYHWRLQDLKLNDDGLALIPA